MIPFDIIKFTFTSKKDYNKMKVNCVSFKMRPFRIFLAKEDPSSTNTIQSRPIRWTKVFQYGKSPMNGGFSAISPIRR